MRRVVRVVWLALVLAGLVRCGGGSDDPGQDLGAPPADTGEAPDAGHLDLGAPDVPTTDTPAEDDIVAPPPTELRLTDDDGNTFVLDWADDAPALTLVRGDDELARSFAPLFAVGTVAAYEPTRLYDPYVHPVSALYREIPGLEWTSLKVVEAVPDADDGGGWSVQLTGGGVTATLRLAVEATGTFRVDWAADGGERAVVLLRINLAAPEGENYYGLGEYFDQAAHRGKTRPMHVLADPSQESGYNEAHVPVPFFVGTRGWGLFVEERRPAAFDMAHTDADRLQITFHQTQGLVLRFFAAGHPLDVPGLYTRVTGAPALPPLWSFAPLQWRDEHNNGAADVLADAEAMRDVDFPVGAIWVDRPWQTGHSSFTFRPDRFPDIDGMVARMHELGYRLAVWHSPYLTEDVADAWAEAEAGGWFVEPPGGSWFHPWDSRMMDFTNPDARDLWQRLAVNATGVGVEGYKLDYAEDIIVGAMGVRLPFGFFSGEDELTMHHKYALYYHQTYAETLPQGGFLLTRTGTYGDQIYTTTIWPGDLCNNFKYHGEADDDPEEQNHVGGLPAAIIGGLTLSLSGYPFYASDTGGYRHSRPSKEVLVRWHEYSALHPIMQIGGGDNHLPWDFTDHGDGVIYDQETLDHCRTYARLHLRLFPYYYTLSQIAHEHGRPVVRPFGAAFPEDGRHPNWTFLVGDDLLAAPVYRGGETTRTVPFPAGRWIDWWDGTAYEGPADITVDAPLGRLPLFLRAGAIVPMLRPTIDSLAPATDPDVDTYDGNPGTLWVRVVPFGEQRRELYDGTTITVVDGTATRIEVDHGGTFDAYRFAIKWWNRPAFGDLLGYVSFNGEGRLAPCAATGEDGCDCWWWDESGDVLWVEACATEHVEIVLIPLD